MKRRASVLFATIIMVMLFSLSAFAAKPKLSTKAVSLKEGKTKTVALKNMKGGTVKWATSNKKIAVVKKKTKNKAVITAKKQGTATIMAKYKGKKYKCKVTVKKASGNSAAATSKDGKLTWSITSPSTMNVEKNGNPFFITVTHTLESGGKSRPVSIKVEDETVLHSTYDSWNLTVGKNRSKNLDFYPLKVGSTTVTFTCDGASKKVKVNVTKDNAEIYNTSLKSYLDSDGNFIKSFCKKFEVSETSYPVEGTAYHDLPYDGYHVGNSQIVIKNIYSGRPLRAFPNGKYGIAINMDYGNKIVTILKLSIVDENGVETQINTLDSHFNAYIESTGQKLSVDNNGDYVWLVHPRTTDFSYGILHVNYRGLTFDIPVGTMFQQY